MQHLDYTAQLDLKQQAVLKLLSAQGVVPRTIREPTRGPLFFYRSKARLGARMVGGNLLAGFRESFSNRVGRMNDCLTLVEPLGDLVAPLKQLISALSCPERVPQIELAAGDRRCAVVLRHLTSLTTSDVTRVEDFAREFGVAFYGQSAGYDSVELLAGEGDVLSFANPDYGVHFQFRPFDFTQVNLAMNRKLVRAAVCALLGPPGTRHNGRRVLELFCGIGNFSLPLAREGFQVVGFEGAEDAVLRARGNAQRNGLLSACEFAVRDLYDPACRDLGGADYLLLDPPRSGAGPNLCGWLETAVPERVVYVSCGPASFATDARTLEEQGYELESVGVFDMFPHTAHVETLGVFARRW